MRLDQLLIDSGHAAGRGEARCLIEDGRVSVDGRQVLKPGAAVLPTAALAVNRPPIAYASRGGIKLASALDTFPVPVEGAIALDAGASTGGFTDVLLRRGAARVYAVDVGYGQLAWTLRSDPRVVVMDRTNVRYLAELPEAPAIATIDLAFISLDLVLPRIQRLLQPDGHAVCLIKPQFEVGRSLVGKGGVVRSADAQSGALRRVLSNALSDGWRAGGLVVSPITGPAGNREFLAWLHHDAALQEIELEDAIEKATGGAAIRAS